MPHVAININTIRVHIYETAYLELVDFQSESLDDGTEGLQVFAEAFRRSCR